MLEALARDFAPNDAWVGSIIGATQAGRALALALGDCWPREPLLLAQLMSLTLALGSGLGGNGLDRSVCVGGLGGGWVLGAALSLAALGFWAATAAWAHKQGR